MGLRKLPARFTRKQLNELGFWDYPGAAGSKLTYSIHPLFARERFEDPSDLWEKIKASLHLASATLQSPASVAFMYSLMNQPHILLAADTQRLGQECTQFWPSNRPEHVMREDVNRKLQLLTNIVTFEWLDNDVTREESDTWAYTLCDLYPSARLEMGAPGSGEKGFGSKISIALSQIRFIIAISICHEVMHALGHAMWDDPLHIEPYHCDQRLNELGFAWETAVFGGTISDTMESLCFYPLNTSTWPSFGDGGEDLVELRGPKRSMKCYFLPMEYVNNIQQQAFWDQPSSDVNLLKIPRLVGYTIHYMRPDVDKDWKSQDTSDVQ